MGLRDPFSINAGAKDKHAVIQVSHVAFVTMLPNLFSKHEGKKISTYQKLFVL